MGRAPCCDKANVKKGPWSPEEDTKLKEYIEKHGTGGNWIALPQKAGLRRCGKSCRLRWLNYLRPNIKHGEFSDDEDKIICSLFASIGSRWSIIAAQLPGRTDNDIKNYWNTKLKKKLLGIMPSSSSSQKRLHFPSMEPSYSSPFTFTASCYENNNNIITSIPSSLILTSSNTCSSPNASAATPTTTTTMVQEQDDYYVGPVHTSFQVQDSLITFGGGAGDQAASCSTSSDGNDGLYVDYAVSKQQAAGVLGRSSLYNGGHYDEHAAAAADEKLNLCYGENPLDYSLEEIKQLISSNSTVSKDFNFFLDENKAAEETAVMYY